MPEQRLAWACGYIDPMRDAPLVEASPPASSRPAWMDAPLVDARTRNPAQKPALGSGAVAAPEPQAQPGVINRAYDYLRTELSPANLASALVRPVVKAATAIPGVFADATMAGWNLATGQNNELPSQATNRVLDQYTRAPSTPIGRVAEDVATAVGAALGGVGVARQIAGAASAVPNLQQRIAGALAQRPGLQVAGAGLGAAGAGTVREQGGNELEQLAAGFIAPLGADFAQMLARGAARGTVGLARTMTRRGQERIAGQILSEQATAPVAAAGRLAEAQELVPGSRPTMGAASGDIGLLTLEKGLRSRATARFGERLSEQNKARQEALDRIAGTEADVVTATRQRNAEAERLLDEVFHSNAEAARKQLGALHDFAARDPGAHRRVPLVSASSWLTRVAKDSGLDLTGYRHTVDSSAVRHMLGSHSHAAREAARGQVPVTRADIERIPDVIASPDYVVFGAQNMSRPDIPIVGYMKGLPDGSTLYLEEVRAGRHQLAATSMRKYPTRTNAESILSTLAPNARSDGGMALRVVRGPVDDNIAGPTAAVLQQIDRVMSGPEGNRDAVAQSMRWLRAKLAGKEATEQLAEGITVSRSQPVSDPRALYEIRKDIGDAMDGKLGGDEAKFRLARKELVGIRELLDDAIEAQAPGFKAYLQRYKELSRPIDQMQVLQQIQQRAALAAPDIATGRDFLSQAKFNQALRSAAKDKKTRRKFEHLSKRQLDVLRAVATDLDMGAAHTSALVRAPGSDTYQNLSIANVLGAITGTANQGIPRWLQPLLTARLSPARWLTELSDKQVSELLVDAALDPRIGSSNGLCHAVHFGEWGLM
ncbi:MAG: hypothetical protein IPI06_02990 [Gammaproteobacteria bacterium]|nr:hypothetical protein [Gammaproteobacteria bacterium]